MTWKQLTRRFEKIMADTSTIPNSAADIEAWREKQKEITEQHLREGQEKRELIAHWFEQDAYINGNWRKRLWLRVQYIFLDISGQMHHSKIPDHIIQELARCLLPDLIAFYETEEGKAAFAQWKAERDAKKKEQSKVA